MTISRSILSGNSAAYGGGIFNNFSTATVSSCELSHNTATYSGGGIDNEGGTLTVNNSSTITGNTAPIGFGADVFNDTLNGGVLIVDSTSTIGILDV